MRRIWRLLCFFYVLIDRSIRLAYILRHVPDDEKEIVKSERQLEATRQLCNILHVQVDLKGDLPEEGALLAVSNHRCLLDPFVISSVMHTAFAAKSEITSWPVLGWICLNAGVIFVQRERRMETTNFVTQVRERLRKSVRVLVFPEGTTGDGRALLPFKTGGFEAVAQMQDGAILPIYLEGTFVEGIEEDEELLDFFSWPQSQSMFQHAWGLLGAKSMGMQVTIGEPIHTANRDRKELASLAYDAVSQLGSMNELQKQVH